MTKRTLTTFALSLVGLLISAVASSAQQHPSGLRGDCHLPLRSSRKSTLAVRPPKAPSYAFSFVDFPDAPDTAALGINPGVSSYKKEIVGAYGATVPLFEGGSGFLWQDAGGKVITYTFQTVNFPGESGQVAADVNDSGEIVGSYEDAAGNLHGYELTGGTFTAIEVPFAGATSTAPYGINNSGQIVGIWNDSAGAGHGFELSGGTYNSFDYPSSTYTNGFRINNNGDIVGTYTFADQVFHGFLLSGGTYASIDAPGAAGTQAFGINDAGKIVGYYCTTTDCVNDQNSAEGFLLSGGTFTTINVPDSSSTIVWGINNKGVIVGSYSNCGGGAGLAHAFIAIP